MSRPVAILTGAASGIGRHFAQVLAGRDRHRLVLADLSLEGMRASFRENEHLHLVELDIASVDGWRRVVDDCLDRWGRIDLLLNIAGGGRPGFLRDQPVENIDLMVDVNLKGPLYGMRLVADPMVRQGSGHIVNIASMAGISPTPGNSLYSAAKSGLRAASIAAGIELRRHGVFVTVVCPGVVDTPLIRQHDDFGEEVALIYSGGRILTVADMEGAIRRALEKRPLEIVVPAGQGRMAKLANAVPALTLRLYPRLVRKGLRRLEKRQRERRPS